MSALQHHRSSFAGFRSLAALGLGIALLTAACSSDDEATSTTVAATESTAPAASTAPPESTADSTAASSADSTATSADVSTESSVAATSGAFPTTVEHEHGSTDVAGPAERIVTLGYSDQDFVLAFGVAPIAVTDWYGDYEYGTWEWALDELGDARPEVLNQGSFTGTANYNYEAITALEPDLIIALYTDMSEEQYELLSQIAPTIAPSGDYPEFGMPWQESTRVVGQALGQPGRAEELIAEVDSMLAEAAAEHPEFAGTEMVVAEMFEPGSSFARSANDPRTKLLTSLGFVLPDEIAELAGDLDGAAIPDEQMDLLDHDLLIWNVGFDDTLRAQIEAKPLYAALDVVEAGHSVFIEDPLVSGALTWGTVLSLPYAIEQIVPLVADNLAG